MADLPTRSPVRERDELGPTEIELPGVRKRDVSVDVEGRRVLVEGDRKDREQEGSRAVAAPRSP